MTDESKPDNPVIKKVLSLPGIASMIGVVTVVGVVIETPAKIIENVKKIYEVVPHRESERNLEKKLADDIAFGADTFNWTEVFQKPNDPNYQKYRSAFRIQVGKLGLTDELKEAYLPPVKDDHAPGAVYEIKRAIEEKRGDDSAQIYDYIFWLCHFAREATLQVPPPDFKKTDEKALEDEEKGYRKAMGEQDSHIKTLLRRLDNIRTPKDFKRLELTLKPGGLNAIQAQIALGAYFQNLDFLDKMSFR